MLIGISGKIFSGKDYCTKLIQYLNHLNIEGVKYTLDKFLEMNDLHRKHLSGISNEKFATEIKKITSLLIGCSVEDLENRDFKNISLGKEWNRFVIYIPHSISNTLVKVPKIFINEEEAYKYIEFLDYKKHLCTIIEEEMTPRKLMQLLGTECGRELIHPNIWVNSLFAKRKEIKSKVVIDDYEEYQKTYPNWIISDVRFPNEVEAILSKGGIVIRIDRDEKILSENWYNNLTNEEKIILFGTELANPELDILNVWRTSQHFSETALDDYDKFTARIKNTTTENLLKDLTEIIYGNNN